MRTEQVTRTVYVDTNGGEHLNAYACLIADIAIAFDADCWEDMTPNEMATWIADNRKFLHDIFVEYEIQVDKAQKEGRSC